jgi:UDP-N-acetylmuramate dehydrogenase
VTLRLRKSPVFNIEYGALKQRLADKKLTLNTIREAVISIRREKLPDTDVLGNAGSFFMNPLVTEEHFRRICEKYPDVPSYPAEGDKVKVPAGWLIEKCGFKGQRHGNVGVYEKQALVLVNFGGATGDEIALFAESIRVAVKEHFGIDLMPEVKYIA